MHFFLTKGCINFGNILIIFVVKTYKTMKFQFSRKRSEPLNEFHSKNVCIWVRWKEVQCFLEQRSHNWYFFGKFLIKVEIWHCWSAPRACFDFLCGCIYEYVPPYINVFSKVVLVVSDVYHLFLFIVACVASFVILFDFPVFVVFKLIFIALPARSSVVFVGRVDDSRFSSFWFKRNLGDCINYTSKKKKYFTCMTLAEWLQLLFVILWKISIC